MQVPLRETAVCVWEEHIDDSFVGPPSSEHIWNVNWSEGRKEVRDVP